MPSEPYTALAEVYQTAGFADYSMDLSQRLMELLFDLDWTGRTMLDLGCGTGDLACWFAGRGMRVTGVDLSPAMLRYGEERAKQDNLNVEFVRGDMRTYKTSLPVDLVVCLGATLNHITTIRELEAVLRVAHAALEPEKLFIFDFRTILGLASADGGDRVVADNVDGHFIVARNTFSYETLALTTTYTIFSNTNGWSRADETHILRGYPVQAVTRMLAQIGFKTVRTLDTYLSDAEDRKDMIQYIFIVQKA